MKENGIFDEYELIQKILQGEVQWYELLIRRTNPYLYKTGRSYRFNHEDTQDLMQETFLDAYRHLSGFENRSSFKTWILKIMLHHCYRKKHKFSYIKEIPNLPDDADIPLFTTFTHSDTQEVIMNRELNVVIEQALLRIPLNYRMVFSLRELNGLSTGDTAEALQITESNVKLRLKRAKSMLRAEIEKVYSAEDIFEFNRVYCDKMVSSVMEKILSGHSLH